MNKQNSSINFIGSLLTYKHNPNTHFVIFMLLLSKLGNSAFCVVWTLCLEKVL